jgi:hypothetical protein
MGRKTLKKKMKGGAWYNPMDWFGSDPNAPKRSWSDWWNSTTSSAENSLASAQTSVSSAVSSVNPFSQQPPVQSFDDQTYSQNSSQSPSSYAMGGKRKLLRNKSKKLKKGGNVASNAAPVTDSNSAKPTYWIKGGTRRRHRKHRK